MDASKRRQIVSIIDDVDDLTIATVREDGFPQATTVSYVNDGLAIYFGTYEGLQKARNILRNNKVSLTINRSYAGWDDIEGLSMGATATRVTDAAESKMVRELMFKKFPQIQNYADPTSSWGELVLFRVDPIVISLLDYRQGFGHTELVDVGQPASA